MSKENDAVSVVSVGKKDAFNAGGYEVKGCSAIRTTTNGIPNEDSLLFILNNDDSEFIHLYVQGGKLVVESNKNIDGIAFKQGSPDKYLEERGIKQPNKKMDGDNTKPQQEVNSDWLIEELRIAYDLDSEMDKEELLKAILRLSNHGISTINRLCWLREWLGGELQGDVVKWAADEIRAYRAYKDNYPHKFTTNIEAVRPYGK